MRERVTERESPQLGTGRIFWRVKQARIIAGVAPEQTHIFRVNECEGNGECVRVGERERVRALRVRHAGGVRGR